MESSDIKKLGIQFGHWVALGVSIIIIIMAFVSTGDPAAQKTKNNITQSLEDLQQAMMENRPREEELVDYKAKIFGNWAPVQIANVAILRIGNIKNITDLVTRLRDAKDNEVPKHILSLLSEETIRLVKGYTSGDPVPETFAEALVRDINLALARPEFYKKEFFENVKMREETERLLYLNPQGDEVIRLNRYLLDDVFVDEIYPYTRVGQDFFYEECQVKYNKASPPSHQSINLPTNLSLQVDREKITVSWESPVAPIDPRTGLEKKLSEIEGYQLRKRWKDVNGKLEEIIFLLEGVSNTLYEDVAVESKIDYFYQVRAYTANTQAQGGKLEKITVEDEVKNVVVSDYTTEQKGTILPSYRMRFFGVSGDTVFIELSKWEKGDWRTASLQLKKGQKIEIKAFNKDLKRYVDFSPGWKLIDINVNATQERESSRREMVINQETRQPEYGPDGKPLYKIETIRVKITVPAIKYLDEKNKEEIKYQENRSDKKKDGEE